MEICKTCGHPFTDHSFHGETRSECHGETGTDEPCECGYYIAAWGALPEIRET